jgi:hypothetical protein
MKGHALRGLFGGFFAGLFLAITLWIYAVIPFASNFMWILPLVGLVIGLALAAWAPFGSSASPESAEGSIGYAPAGDADPAQTSGTTLEHDVVEVPPADHRDDTEGSADDE